MTEETSTMSSPEKTLGNERIIEICQGFALEEADIAVVIKILRKWEMLTGEPIEKFKIGEEETSNNDKRQDILLAIMKITREFASRPPPTTTVH